MSLAVPLQHCGGKLPPAPGAGFARGGQAEGGRAQRGYVHTNSNNSQVLVFRGTTENGAETLKREESRKLKDRLIKSLNASGREREAKAYASCGDYFDVWAKNPSDVKLLPCPCNHMFCRECAERRSRPLVKKLAGMVNRPKRDYWFLTFSPPNQADISRWDVLRFQRLCGELQSSWVFQAFEGADGKPNKIYGGARSIECVYNRGVRHWREKNVKGKWVERCAPDASMRGWHPHVHYLLECPKELPGWWLVLLKAEIKRIFGDVDYVRLEPAYYISKRGKKITKRLNRKALREVCKYVTKSVQFADDHLLVDEFLSAFKGIRRIQCFGSYFGKKKENVCREPGEDDAGISEAEIRLSAEGYRKLPIKAHYRDTELLPDGTRQLTFEFMEKVRAFFEEAEPPWALTSEEFFSDTQNVIGFSGVLPEMVEPSLSLFEGAA